MQSQVVQASFDSYPSPSPHESTAGPSLGEQVGEAELVQWLHDSRAPGPSSRIKSETPTLQKTPLKRILIRNVSVEFKIEHNDHGWSLLLLRKVQRFIGK